MIDYKTIKEKAEKAGALTDMTPAFYEFKEEGAGFAGRLKAISSVSSGLSQGTYNQYLFETDDGLIKCAFGSATDKEVAPMMRVGDIYVVEYSGKIKISGGRSVNKFKVFAVDESMIPADKK